MPSYHVSDLNQNVLLLLYHFMHTTLYGRFYYHLTGEETETQTG